MTTETTKAEELLEAALEAYRNEDGTAIEATTEALAALYLEAGETPHTVVLDVADYAERLNEPEPACTCPPGLVERGGFQSSCPVHGSA